MTTLTVSNAGFRLPPRYQPINSNPLQGGFGSVQPVIDTYLGRTVLFKWMQDPANDAQLLNEIQHLSKARSRHVVEIYDVVKADDGHVTGIIIEQLTGRDYLTFYQEAHSNPDGYLRALYQIATALVDLHNAGIVHRDLKLENLRSSASGILKLFDFGISCAGSGYHTLNNRGTFVYAGPELYVPGAAITTELDIYAFGVCAWALASDTFPWPMLERPPQSTARAPSIDTVLTGLLPRDVVTLIDACLDPNPVARPTAQQLSQSIAKHLVRGRHKGIFTRSNTNVFELSQTQNNVGLKIGHLGELKVHYDGIAFRVSAVTGDVYINNAPVVVGMELHGACVITFGNPSLGWQREWFAFSSSHPEVIL